MRVLRGWIRSDTRWKLRVIPQIAKTNFRECKGNKCELCGLSSSSCLSCQNNLVGVNNNCDAEHLKKCSVPNCQNCSLIESQVSVNSPTRSTTNNRQTSPGLQNTTSEICMKCKPGFSLGPELTCIETGEGCRIYDSANKRCLQCLFEWYMNGQFECSKGEGG